MRLLTITRVMILAVAMLSTLIILCIRMFLPEMVCRSASIVENLKVILIMWV